VSSPNERNIGGVVVVRRSMSLLILCIAAAGTVAPCVLLWAGDARRTREA
jgi:hypothetical protein